MNSSVFLDKINCAVKLFISWKAEIISDLTEKKDKKIATQAKMN
jgi:hypothetical protein